MKFCGLLRVRNQADLVVDTLDHMATFCNEVFVFDDASEDDTRMRAYAHPVVEAVRSRQQWSPRQDAQEGAQRGELFEYAKRHTEAEWFFYLDCDERVEFDDEVMRTVALRPEVSALRFRLWDFYMTEDDHVGYLRDNKLVELRKWCGPEYRDIVMAWQRDAAVFTPGQLCMRVPQITGAAVRGGDVRHYGKAMSVADWQRKCLFYMQCFPQYAAKWKQRRGLAIHEKSDFDAALVEWENRHQGAVPVPV